MSFRMFIYYCAMTGGCAALVGWALGRMASGSSDLLNDCVRGLFLGMLVAAGLGFVDALLNIDYRQVGQLAMRVGVTVIVGAFGGLIGGLIGHGLFKMWSPFLVIGWTFTGFLIGAAIGVF